LFDAVVWSSFSIVRKPFLAQPQAHRGSWGLPQNPLWTFSFSGWRQGTSPHAAASPELTSGRTRPARGALVLLVHVTYLNVRWVPQVERHHCRCVLWSPCHATRGNVGLVMPWPSIPLPFQGFFRRSKPPPEQLAQPQRL